MTFESDEDAFELHVDSWNRYVILLKSDFVVSRNLHSHKPVLAGIIPPMFMADPAKAAVIASHNMQYHLKLGMSKIYIFVTKGMGKFYLKNPVIAELHRQNKIAIMVWKDIPECVSPPSCLKVLVEAYAVLGLWGTGEHVLITDVDEILTLPPSRDMEYFMRECVGNSPLAKLMRYNIVCDDCTGEFDEFRMWTRMDSNPFKHYSSVIGYEREDASKAVVDTNNVHGFALHTGAVLEGIEQRVDINCSRILHFPNMFRARNPYGSWNQSWDEWQWVL